MAPWSHLLCVLVLLSVLAETLSTPICNNQCCRFVEGFPARLRELRVSFLHIRDFYTANDDLDSALLDQTVEDSIKSDFACQTIDSILGFYLSTILPKAAASATDDTANLKPHVESIQEIFDQLKSDVTQCRHYFSCKKHFDISNLTSTYNKMANKGLFKAMGELDLFFNYIESYLASQRRA
ncbi:interleukin-10 [Oryzias melastigma]|uniref:Interleukin family protein n=1 Tax=Oryzias melastigma TaxID=30732 RepID=A0A3B3DUQ1_ORYME|nr:interleukin-10 [Oryzias melastigma]